MTSADQIEEALRKEISELKFRVQELDYENTDLRNIFTKKGIQYKDLLAAERHRRYFARLCGEYPISRFATSSEVQRVRHVMHRLAAFSGSIVRTGLIS